WNVKTKHAVQWWHALQRNGVPRKIWLSQSAHTSPLNIRPEEWLRQLHAWFDHWLYGVRNGIMREPQADVEIAPGRWVTHRSWPPPGTLPLSVPLGRNGTDAFTDQRTRTAQELATAPETPDDNRLAYLSPVLKHDVRISGTPTIEVRASFTGGRS